MSPARTLYDLEENTSTYPNILKNTSKSLGSSDCAKPTYYFSLSLFLWQGSSFLAFQPKLRFQACWDRRR